LTYSILFNFAPSKDSALNGTKKAQELAALSWASGFWLLLTARLTNTDIEYQYYYVEKYFYNKNPGLSSLY